MEVIPTHFDDGDSQARERGQQALREVVMMNTCGRSLSSSSASILAVGNQGSP
jgi:hypothetical protein